MKSAGLTPLFAPMVAHSIHSLTLEDLRYHFKDNATEDNGIPTVNPDFESDQRVLPDAPLVGYDDEFSTQAMKSFDLVMRNMNRTWWGGSEYHVLEKVAHALHMAEVWSAAGKEYRRVGKLVEADSHLCRCVRDVDGSGVIDHLHLIALKLRYPSMSLKNDTTGKYHLIALRKKRGAPLKKVNPLIDHGPVLEYDTSTNTVHGGYQGKLPMGIAKGSLGVQVDLDEGLESAEFVFRLELIGKRYEHKVNIKEVIEDAKDAVEDVVEKIDDFVDKQIDKAKDLFGDDDEDDDEDDYDYYYDYSSDYDDSKSSSSSSYSSYDDDDYYYYYDDDDDDDDYYDDDDDDDDYWGWGSWWRRSHQSDGSDELNFSLSDLELLKDVAVELVEEDVELGHIESVEEWEYWRKMLKLPKEDSASFELALFMHCMLN